ncbi:MAG: RNA polymerase sigma factor [Proteobacteria bacterium]|nr:RNA polymerase sigma factor [Pseudomonadota bacterium]
MKKSRGGARDRILPYLQRLYGYAQFLTRDLKNAEDLVQDASVKVLAAKRQPDEEPAYRAWLFRIVKNAYIDRYRQQQRRQATEINFEAIDEISLEYHVRDERLINRVAVRAAIARLKPDHAEILALIDIGGLSYREAADVLECPVGTVMSRISRARAALLAILDDQGIRVVETPRQRERRG